ncbi:MAG: cysteine desulfurase [Candidatus Omnitrophica bacterium]|nr:cysteine desulfurase [Candidatus Omnitrophota bacterium]
MSSIYLDYAATTPCDPLVGQAMAPYFFERFGNASSPHSFGQSARKALEDSRALVADFIGAKPSEIIFTSGATEANNHAIFFTARALKNKGRHVIISAVEHHSVLEPARRLQAEGFDVSFVKPTADGIIDPPSVEDLIREDTILMAIHHANNEIGVLEPVEEIGTIARQKGIYFLVDATQTVGHIPVDVRQICCDFLSLSAHKFYGPQGVGALYVREGIKIDPWLLGGDQERGRRASTHNLAAIVGLGKAVHLCRNHREKEAKEQSALRDRIIEYVLNNIPGVVSNGHRQRRLPNNAHFAFENISGEELVAALDMAGIAVSQGSACTWGALEASHVLKAIGLSDRMALGSLRISLGRWTTSQDVDYFLQQLKLKVEKIRR